MRVDTRRIIPCTHACGIYVSYTKHSSTTHGIDFSLLIIRIFHTYRTVHQSEADSRALRGLIKLYHKHTHTHASKNTTIHDGGYTMVTFRCIFGEQRFAYKRKRISSNICAPCGKTCRSEFIFKLRKFATGMSASARF